ncbi:hypothetical protein TbrSNM41_22020 (plasmid) [Thermus brockianus]|uniref:Uncharacterized protein n=1 Tax=Thermus brockianus TaxID=56956 RepID=A0ABN6NL27_THEBO|nr:hypothetical protein TbrSNM41_22020 [Thermus brockianus]
MEGRGAVGYVVNATPNRLHRVALEGEGLEVPLYRAFAHPEVAGQLDNPVRPKTKPLNHLQKASTFRHACHYLLSLTLFRGRMWYYTLGWVTGLFA